MAKTVATEDLERRIYFTTKKMGTFGCFEVTIGFGGKERVDYMTYDTKGVWRCYEIKTSVSDFRSKSKNTFVGHLNYYVMPHELFTKVRDEIPAHIGVYVNGISVDKRAKRQELLIDEQVLKDSFIRSLDREHQKFYKSQSKTIIQNTERKLRNLEQSKERYQQENRRLTMHLQHKFGRNWRQIIGWE